MTDTTDGVDDPGSSTDGLTPEVKAPAVVTVTTSPPVTRGPAIAAAAATTAAAVREPPRPWWKAKPRPKYPNDWRKIVGGLGWLLITSGVLVLLFVVYQLWGTSIQYAAAQDDLSKQFVAHQAKIAEANVAGPVTAARSSVPATAPRTAAATVTPTASSTSTASSTPTASSTAPATAAVTPTTTAAATATSQATVASTSPPAPFPGAPIQLGDAIGRILIPKIGVNDVIVAGVRTQDIAKGVGHFPDTPMPGQQGNAALAGHRTTHGAVFGDLDKLVPGDEVDVIDLDAKRYTYLVTGSFVVHPNQIEVLADHPDKVMLTLTTCNPKYTARDRLVVTAELRVGGDEPAVQPATPRYGNPGLYANGVNADDTTSSLGPNEGDTLAPGATTVPGSPSTGRTVSSNVDSLGALNHGWFSDSQAILPVVLWGLALVALALLAWGLSRKTRRLIGWGVALVPFIVLLYFWFENVNRLLPPNL